MLDRLFLPQFLCPSVLCSLSQETHRMGGIGRAWAGGEGGVRCRAGTWSYFFPAASLFLPNSLLAVVSILTSTALALISLQ